MRLRSNELLRDIQPISDREKNKVALPSYTIKGEREKKAGKLGGQCWGCGGEFAGVSAEVREENP